MKPSRPLWSKQSDTVFGYIHIPFDHSGGGLWICVLVSSFRCTFVLPTFREYRRTLFGDLETKFLTHDGKREGEGLVKSDKGGRRASKTELFQQV